jgi:hypothetical protein
VLRRLATAASTCCSRSSPFFRFLHHDAIPVPLWCLLDLKLPP